MWDAHAWHTPIWRSHNLGAQQPPGASGSGTAQTDLTLQSMQAKGWGPEKQEEDQFWERAPEAVSMQSQG